MEEPLHIAWSDGGRRARIEAASSRSRISYAARMDADELARCLATGVRTDTVRSRTTAIDDADLPTGPVAAARFAWRLRRGHEPEVERLKGVVAGLRARLDASRC